MKKSTMNVLSSNKHQVYVWFYNQKDSQAFQKHRWRHLNTKVCGSEVLFLFSSYFCSTMITREQCTHVIYTQNECSSKHLRRSTNTSVITWTEVIQAIHSHTSLLSIAMSCHVLVVYACTHVVLFPNHFLLGTRLALFMEEGLLTLRWCK